MEKKIPLWILLLVAFFAIISVVTFGSLVEYASSQRGDKLGELAPIILRIAQFPSIAKQAFAEIKDDQVLLVKNRFPSIDGLKKNGVVQEGAKADDGYLLVSVYDGKKNQSLVKLMRISDQKILHEWVPNIPSLKNSQNTSSAIFDKTEITERRYRLFAPLLLNDGSLAFGNQGPLYKINICAKIEMVVDGIFHHATELDSSGNIWKSSVIEPSSYPNEKYPNFRDDAIVKISPDGKILFKKSVTKILEENGYRGLVFGVGMLRRDAIHLNDIQPALYSTKYWQKDDLLMSMRTLSTVMIYRPSTNKIMWLKTGPWLKQHDVDFIGQSKISIFGDDVFDFKGKLGAVLPDSHNNIYIFDLSNASITTPYTKALKKMDVRTLTEGRLQILPNGDAFIEETNYGRLLRISPDKAEWEFTEKFNDQTVGMLSWSRYLTKEQVSHVLPALEKQSCH